MFLPREEEWEQQGMPGRAEAGNIAPVIHKCAVLEGYNEFEFIHFQPRGVYRVQDGTETEITNYLVKMDEDFWFIQESDGIGISMEKVTDVNREYVEVFLIDRVSIKNCFYRENFPYKSSFLTICSAADLRTAGNFLGNLAG